MLTSGSGSVARVRAATRADVIAVAGVIAVVGLLVGLRDGPIQVGPPTRIGDAIAMPEMPTCRANLAQIGQAVALCRAENNGFAPMANDGGACGPSKITLNWVDVLYDLGYLPNTTLQRCPKDEHPDYPTRLRGEHWDFKFVDVFDANETPRFGVRTSYAINDVAQYGWAEDVYPDASRQVFATDGWWDWLACLNAIWFYYESVTGTPPGAPDTFPSWASTMVAWRHPKATANALFFDGSVRAIPTRVPTTILELRDQTVDTELAFTWLPGEQTMRFGNDAYRGTHAEWRNRYPRLAGGGGTWVANPAMPDILKPFWRSGTNAWVKLPNPGDRH